MILTSNEFSPSSSSVATGVCIVGAGAAGITLACELDRSGISVLLLEAGGYAPDADSAADYVGQAGKPHPETTEFRRVKLGGTTGIWGGRCVPYDPIDFERRDYLANSGWPIAYEEVAQHYPRAMQYCDAGRDEFSVSGSLKPGAGATIADLGANDVLLGDRIERYSLPTDFGKRYRDKLRDSPNITAVLHARCTNIVRAPGEDRVAAIEVTDRAGRVITVTADAFVLAGGGIEVARLLLNADRANGGLGNRNDLVGRYYACHFENTVGRITPGATPIPFQFEKTTDGVYARRKLQFSADALRRHRLLNTAFRFHFPEYSDASHGSAVMSTIFLAKSVLIPEYRAILQHSAAASADSPASAHIKNVITGLPQLAKFGYQWLFLRQLAERKLPYTLVANADGSFPLEFNCEQTPLADSRVTLTGEDDRHGMKRVRVDWKVSADDIDAAHRGFALLRDTLQAHSGARLTFDDATLRTRLAGSVPLGGHHIGSTRMGANEREGVVDRDCAVFNLPNLFIASSSVFPTSSHANPTLTIVAMAIRLAAHLKSTHAR